MEIEGLCEMQGAAYHKARHYHQYYSASPVVEYLNVRILSLVKGC
jgi:hypothetical protein